MNVGLSTIRPLAHRPVIHVVLAVVLLAGAGALVTALAPEERGPTRAVATQVPVSETLVACPGLRSSEGYTESTVAAATPPQVRGVDDTAPGNGVVRTLTPNAGKDKTLIKLTSPGDRGTYTGRNGERDSVTGSADGSLAPGFSVTQTERTVDGKGRGLASTQCFPTGNDFWFVGSGVRCGRTGRPRPDKPGSGGSNRGCLLLWTPGAGRRAGRSRGGGASTVECGASTR